ncbi:MAG: hypothetical protein H7Y03_10015 [Chitinophagaceae bacterium]|nr:hypothetical protein [Chitinophagaceae bacterium]
MQFHSVSVVSAPLERRKNNSGLLHGFTGFLLILKSMDFARIASPYARWILFILSAIGLISVFLGFVRKKIPAYGKWSKRFFILEGVGFLVLTAFFIPEGKPVHLIFTIVWTFLCGFFYFSEKRTERQAFVSLQKEGITIPGVLNDRLMPWSEVESVILRCDFLTINKKNNKYYQFEVAEENEEGFREAFNIYARSRLE